MSSPAARRRLAARTDFYNAKVIKAQTPMERCAVLFDQWRSLIAEVPDATGAQMVDVIAKGLENHITHLTQMIDPNGGPR